ncbi:NAD-dependent epimerase/dehydratase [Beutenbergia cavernae DSM 12333]|uniref:NAD-dependent epimerase/dehydratase n=1 Tax=Beutenbergia cavernae (strain ATCC BAA-8 / DSM 12333 / CCUG 43141 / JCM 11478 / NBRC 16432 / NCIMB 13614 / HKI 0122) TaxID=471853 RepID=C5BYU2_BEUC1|nr:NAD(P)-dependent oxidoreductase [Beutenbergia cavernae]ACQ79050.1 NAD-dependent epimerase/dehydratase [Beutenbergia cavernae DSM 12333]
MRVAVTGGAGRLGRSVVAGLAAAGHEVTSLDLRPVPGPPDDGAAHLRIDLADAVATRATFATLAPQALVHLAAIAVPFSRPEHEIWDLNTSVTFHAVDAALAAGADHVLIASSPTVLGYGAPLGWSPSYLPLDEAHPIAPWNAYALSKAAMESIGRMVATQRGDDVRVASFRPCYVIAPEEWAGAPTQQGHTVAQRLADPALAAASLFNYVDARDAAGFVERWLEAAREAPNAQTYLVGAADAFSARPTADVVAEHLPALAPFAAGVAGHDPLFSVAKAERELGWRPERTWRAETAGGPARGAALPDDDDDAAPVERVAAARGGEGA